MIEQLSLFKLLKSKKRRKVQSPKKRESKPVDNNKLSYIGHEIEILRRPYQRTLRVFVRLNGQVRVTCGKLTSKQALLKFLTEHTDWLNKALLEQKNIRNQFPQKKFIQGENFLYMGGIVYLNFTPGTGKKISMNICGELLNVFVPPQLWTSHYAQESHPELKGDIVKFYKSLGKKLLQARLNYFSEKMQLFQKKVSYRSQKTRW